MENINNKSNRKNKNNYYYKSKYQKNKNCYYSKNKKYYYMKKKKDKEENILLSKDKTNLEENEIIKGESQKEKSIQKEYTPVRKNENIAPKIPVFKMAIGIIILCAIIFGVSYSYFNYYQEDSRQADIAGGEAYVRISQPSETVNLTLNKLYPRTAEEARRRNDNYVDFIVSAKNTSETKALYYTLDFLDGDAIQGKNRINRNHIKVDLQQKVNNEYTYIQEAVNLSDFDFKGMIPSNSSNVTPKEYRLRIWVSEDVLISDTEVGRTYTQSEFANLYASYHISINSYDGKEAICVRATKLHTEKCSNTNNSFYCQADGYTLNANITYGRLGTNGFSPTTGDAFDCDVNNDGIFNSKTERFYYVSNYFDTALDEPDFDTTRATLIYYRNFVDGSPSDGGVAYYGTNGAGNYDNYHGPIAAIASLPVASASPTENEWRSDLLKTADRKVLSCNAANCTSLSDKTNNESNIINTGNTPIYNGKAARLLTVPEINAGCGENVGSIGNLNGVCNFLLEKTLYASSDNSLTEGTWLENPKSSSSLHAFQVGALTRIIGASNTYFTDFGARPVIDVLYTDIFY